MVQVIQQPPGIQLQCRHCQAMLMYTYQDVIRGRSTDYTGVSDPYAYIICPVCMNKNHVSAR